MARLTQYAHSFCKAKDGRKLCSQKDLCQLHHEYMALGGEDPPIKSRVMTLPRVDGRECHFFVELKK